MHAALATILVLLGASVVTVVVCRLVRMPPILGYLIVGLTVGPHALGFVEDTPMTHYLGEFGIVFLMFSLGLEFSLSQLRAMRRAVFGLCFAQVACTTLAGVLLAALAGFGWQAGLVLGGAFAMSSTAIVTKMLTERGEIATPHGRDIVAILLFQDLAVVAFLVVIPALQSSGGINYPAIECKHIVERHCMLLRVETIQVGEKKACSVANATIRIRCALEVLIRHDHLVAIIGCGNP